MKFLSGTTFTDARAENIGATTSIFKLREPWSNQTVLDCIKSPYPHPAGSVREQIQQCLRVHNMVVGQCPEIIQIRSLLKRVNPTYSGPTNGLLSRFEVKPHYDGAHVFLNMSQPRSTPTTTMHPLVYIIGLLDIFDDFIIPNFPTAKTRLLAWRTKSMEAVNNTKSTKKDFAKIVKDFIYITNDLVTEDYIIELRQRLSQSHQKLFGIKQGTLLEQSCYWQTDTQFAIISEHSLHYMGEVITREALQVHNPSHYATF